MKVISRNHIHLSEYAVNIPCPIHQPKVAINHSVYHIHLDEISTHDPRSARVMNGRAGYKHNHGFNQVTKPIHPDGESFSIHRVTIP